MIQTDSIFLACVDKGQVLSLVMLPNIRHITDPEARLEIKNKLNDVLAYHSTRKVTSGRLVLTNGEEGSRVVNLYANSPFKSKEITKSLFAFQKAKKRFLAHDLMDEEGNLRSIHPRQQSYLDGKLISHCWAAIHKGHVVGLIAYPIIRNNKMHDKNFEKYKTLARIALQKFGYVVACDLVLNNDHKLEIYNIHSSFERKGKVLPYFTRLLPLTSHLKFRNHLT
ncbi:hypothetical protein ACQWTT_001074 [Acinetobacter baumannii]